MTFSAEQTLKVSRLLNAPVERVFEAWTKAEVLAQWFGPPSLNVAESFVDLRVGGKYRISLDPGNGALIEHWGEYVAVSPPNKLVFTWVLENQECLGSCSENADTLVTIEFREQGEKTEIQLTHEKLPSIAAKEGHAIGWGASLNSLELFLS